MRLAGALLAAGGCALPCLPLADAPIDATAAPNADEWRTALRETMLEFDRWTAGGACVSEVRVGLQPWVERADRGSLGTFNLLNRSIRIDESITSDQAGSVLRHELCHAWDQANGRPSLSNPDRFPAAMLPHDLSASPDYADDGDAIREVFAVLCEQGPVDRKLLSAMAEANCETGFSSGEEWIQREVFSTSDPGWVSYAGAADATVSIRGLDQIAANRVYRSAFSGDALWVLTVEHAPPQFVLWRVPLLGGPTVGYPPFPATDPLPVTWLVPGAEEGLFVASWGTSELAWRLADQPRPWQAVGVPAEQREGVLRVEDETWTLLGTQLTRQPSGAARPRQAALVPPELPVLRDRSLHVWGDQLGFTATADGWPVVGSFDEAVGTWAPAPTAAPMAALADGRRVAVASRWSLGLGSVLREPADGDFDRSVILVEDVASGGWRVAACDGTLYEAPGSLQQVRAAHAWGGEVWMLIGDYDGLSLVSVRAD